MQSYKWEMYVVIQEINLQNKRQKSDHIFVKIFGYPFPFNKAKSCIYYEYKF